MRRTSGEARRTRRAPHQIATGGESIATSNLRKAAPMFVRSGP
jgi:hypothetical protein